jgi:hypothetical protein
MPLGKHEKSSSELHAYRDDNDKSDMNDKNEKNGGDKSSGIAPLTEKLPVRTLRTIRPDPRPVSDWEDTG